MSFFFLFLGLFFIAVIIHSIVKRRQLTFHRFIEIVLLYFLVILIGLSTTWAGMGHIFKPDLVANYIGWPTGSPFQFEVGVAGMAFGIIGILCIFIRGTYWIAAGLGISIFYLGAAYGHIYQLKVLGNTHPGNVRLPLYIDLIMPGIFFLLIILFYATRPKSQTS